MSKELKKTIGMVTCSEAPGVIKYATSRLKCISDYMNTCPEAGIVKVADSYKAAIAITVRRLRPESLLDDQNAIIMAAFNNELESLERKFSKIGRCAAEDPEQEVLFLADMLDEIRLTQSAAINLVINEEINLIETLAIERQDRDRSFTRIAQRCSTINAFLHEYPQEIYLEHFAEYALGLPSQFFSDTTIPAAIQESFWRELDADGIFGKCLPGFYIEVRDRLENRHDSYSYENYLECGVSFMEILASDIFAETSRSYDDGPVKGMSIFIRRRQAEYIIKHTNALLETLEQILASPNYPGWAAKLYQRVAAMKSENAALLSMLPYMAIAR